MKEIGISPEDKVICFGQLLGMCDYITMPLGKSFSGVSVEALANPPPPQVKLDTRPTSTSPMVQSTKSCHISRAAPRRTRACWRRFRRRSGCCWARSSGGWPAGSSSTSRRASTHRYKKGKRTQGTRNLKLIVTIRRLGCFSSIGGGVGGTFAVFF